MSNKEKLPKEGRRVKSQPPMARISPYIMKIRADSQNYLSDSLEVSGADSYIQKKRNEGLKGFGMLHLFIAAYVRTLSQRPAINRFIRGQKVYTKDHAEITFTIKKEMTLDSPDTVLKLFFPLDATSDDIYRIVTDAVEKSRKEDSSFDDTARMLNYIPGLVLKGTVWLLRFFDYFGLLPRFLTGLSPFHGSFAITSMGSLGIPPIYHHLYDFGTIPVFCSYGAKYTKNELTAEGEVVTKKYLDYKFVTDERICDGHYFASALKLFKYTMREPSCLDTPPQEIIKDIP